MLQPTGVWSPPAKLPQAQVMCVVAGAWGAVRTEAGRGSGAVRIQEGGPGTFAGSKGGESRQSLYGHSAKIERC